MMCPNCWEPDVLENEYGRICLSCNWLEYNPGVLRPYLGLRKVPWYVRLWRKIGGAA